MSFSSTTKDELVKLKLRGAAEKKAVLAAITHTAGALKLNRSGISVQYVTENHGVARLIASLAASLYTVQASIAIREQEGLRSRSVIVQLSGDCLALLTEAGCLGTDDTLPMGSIPASFQETDRIARCFLRGAFLGAGSLNDPKKGYHLEIVCRHEAFATALCAMLEARQLAAKVTPRKTSYIVYIKEGEAVADFLRLIGASQSTLAFEHARIIRNVSNNLNRQRNFEEANMQKAAQACAEQLVDIERIRRETGLDSLPHRLFEAAEARLNHPEATLAELAALLGVSKSGLKHRFEKIAERANDLRVSHHDA